MKNILRYLHEIQDGRINRRNYTLGLIFLGVSFFAIYILLLTIADKISSDSILGTFIVIISLILPLVFLLFVWSLHIRRLHDRGHSGLWILFFPIDFWLNLIIKGQSTPNKYGDSPTGNMSFFKEIFNLY